MSLFWASLFGHLKGCGRNATLFIATLVLFLMLLVAGSALWQSQLREYLWPVPCLVAVGSFYWFYRTLRQWRIRRRQRLERARLSDDELRVAIGKLGRKRNSLAKPPTGRVNLPPVAPF